MSEEEPKEKEQQIIHVFPRDINKKKFVLKHGKETVIILEEDEYEESD